MPTHYDKKGNIPGPGQSRVGTIPRWQSEEDEAVLKHENRWGKEIEDISKDIIVTTASQGKFGSTPASEQTIDVQTTEILTTHPEIIRKAKIIYQNNPDAGWGVALRSAKLSAGSSPENLRRRFMKSPKDRFPDSDIAGGVTNKYEPERTGKVSKSDVPLKKSIYEGAAITNVEELDRAAAALVQRRIGTLSGAEFNKWTKEATADLQQTYKHITSGELNAHHNNIVKSGVSLHEGRTGPESMLIESWLLNKGVASGNNPLNNNLIPEQVHGLVHKWMNERVGKKYLTGLIGELNSPERKQWEQLPIDHPDVKKVVEQYADYVNGATERTAELMQAYYQIWGPESQITTSTLEELYTKLGINELEYNQLIKPGLSGKDARMFAQGYGPKKIKITWADGTTESIYERLLDELNNDPQLAAKIDALNRPQVKVGDFSNEPASLTPAQQRVKRWNDEYEELTSMKREGIKLTRTEKNRMKELKGLIYYQPDIPGMLFKVFDERIPKEGPFNESHGGWRYKK